VLQAFAGGGVTAAENAAAVVGGDVFARDFALADEFTGEAGGAAAFGGGTAEDEGVAAIFDNRLGRLWPRGRSEGRWRLG
jgi:hypothetical protein